jgi:urease accessory protein
LKDTSTDASGTDTVGLAELGILQLSDSFFPTGMYATSNGLEAMYYAKKMRNVQELRSLLEVYIGQQVGPTDCNAVSKAIEFAERSELDALVKLDQVTYAMKLCQETRDASARSGNQLLRCLGTLIGGDLVLDQYTLAIQEGRASGVYPVALGVACRAFGIPKERAAVMMLYTFTVSVVGAAIRLGVATHFDGQNVIHALKPTILRTARKSVEAPVSRMWQFAAEIDIFQMVHEEMNSRMFIS